MSELTEIYNWRDIDGRITTSGQPAEEQLVSLNDHGVTHIVNLGMHDHERALADETRSVTSLGMDYIHIPILFDDPKESDFEIFCEAMAKLQNARVHVHCIVNLRVSAFMYRYQRDVLGLPEAEARSVMDSMWQPGGVWAKFIGDEARIDEPHGPPVTDSVDEGRRISGTVPMIPDLRPSQS